MSRTRRMQTKMAAAAAILLAASCGGEAGETTTTTTPAETTSRAVNGIAASDSELGRILVDPQGMTLYVFTPDAGGESNCHDDCAALWPPVAADTPIAPGLDGSMFGSTARTDGRDQLTFNGWPLYLFVSDTAPGEVNGQGVNDVWFVIGDDGEMLTSPTTAGESGGGSTVPDYGY